MDMELACEADTAVDQKTVATEATRPSRGRYIVCRNHQGAEKDAADRAQWPSLCQREAVESTLRQICARSLACFGRGQALAPACKGDQGLVGNWIF